MTKLIPFSENIDSFPHLQHDVFDNFLDYFFEPQLGMKYNPRCLAFRMDVKEKDKSYIIEADLPGVRKEDINIRVDGQVLNISVRRSNRSDESDDGYIRRERWFSSMSRSIRLPDGKMDDVRARLENGVLTLTVAKRVAGEDGPHRITIE